MVLNCSIFPSLSAIAPHLAKEQAANSARRGTLASVPCDSTDDRALGRPGQRIFTRRGPRPRSGDITEQGTPDSARCGTLAGIPSDTADDGTPGRSAQCITTDIPLLGHCRRKQNRRKDTTENDCLFHLTP